MPEEETAQSHSHCLLEGLQCKSAVNCYVIGKVNGGNSNGKEPWTVRELCWLPGARENSFHLSMGKRGEGKKKRETVTYILQVATSIRFKERAVLYSECVILIFQYSVFLFF